MSRKQADPGKFSELRQQAEATLADKSLDVNNTSPQELKRVVHELQVHKIELELQNEALRRAQFEAELAQERYAQLYDAAPVGYVTMDEDDTIVEANKTAAHLLTRNITDLIGQRLTRLILAQDQDHYHFFRQKMAKSTEVQQVRLKLIQSDESQFYAQLQGQRRRNSGALSQSHQQHPQFYLTISNITELVETEQAYQTLVDNSLQGLAIIQEGRIVFTNPAMERITGYSEEEILAASFEGVAASLHPDDRARVLENMAGKTVTPHLETRFTHKNGETHWLESHASPIHYRSKPAIQVACLDITERKSAEEALRKSEELYRVTISSISDAVIITDNAGQLTYICPNIENIFGYSVSEAEAIGNISGLLGDTIYDPAALEAAGELKNIELETQDKAGSHHVLLVNVKQVFIQQGTVLYTCRDITERKQTESELAHLLETVTAQREQLKYLAAKLAETQEAERKTLARELHDQVGQQLTSLNLNLNTLRAHYLAASPAASPAIFSLIDHALKLVETTTERIQNVLAELRPPVLDDYGLLAALRWYTSELAPQVAFTIKVQGTEPDPRLKTSVELAMFRMTQEAMTNIIKHSRAGQVTIQLEANQTVRLIITDDGLGFEVERLPKPAERTGWGLLTMTERIEAVGGTCRIESSPGQGTQIIVEVPR